MQTPHEKVDSVFTYLGVYLALMVLLAATIVCAQLDLGEGNTFAALGIAVLKMILVILFFMHVRHNAKLVWVFVISAFLWLSILLCLTMTDYSSRGWEPTAMKGMTRGNRSEPNQMLELRPGFED